MPFYTGSKPLYLEKEGDYVLFTRIGYYTGSINGYIGVPMYSEYALDHHDDIPFSGIVHGSLTYSGYEEIDGADYWVFGFDTAHSGDVPFIRDVDSQRLSDKGHVWNINDVMEQLYMLLEEFKKGGDKW